MVFDNSKRSLRKAFGDDPRINIENFKLTQSFLRLEQPLVALSTLYTFPVLVNQSPLNNTEQRLNLQDSFVISEVGIFTGVATSATDAAWDLKSYPNFFLYAANTGPMSALYSGKLIISVNNNTIVPAWDVARHRFVGQTQQNAALAAAAAGPFSDQVDQSLNGWYPMEPNVVLIGSKNYVVQIQLPVGISAVTANSRVVVMFRGILAQNSTVVS